MTLDDSEEESTENFLTRSQSSAVWTDNDFTSHYFDRSKQSEMKRVLQYFEPENQFERKLLLGMFSSSANIW